MFLIQPLRYNKLSTKKTVRIIVDKIVLTFLKQAAELSIFAKTHFLCLK